MRKYLVTGLIFCSIKLFAQDPFFTQAFNAPLTLNPATAGNAEMDLRFTATYKRQWINVPSTMQYAAVGLTGTLTIYMAE